MSEQMSLLVRSCRYPGCPEPVVSSGALYRFSRGEAIRLGAELLICALGVGRDSRNRGPFARYPIRPGTKIGSNPRTINGARSDPR